MNKLKLLCELGFIRGLTEISKPNKGKVENLYRKLKTTTDKKLKSFEINYNILKKVKEKIMIFEDLTGWGGQAKNICTYLSFLCAICEQDKKYYNEILQILNILYAHFEAHEGTKHNLSGIIAFDEWVKMWQD